MLSKIIADASSIESIATFLARMNDQEKEWVLQELAESVGVKVELPASEPAPQIDTPLMTRAAANAAARRTPPHVADTSEPLSPIDDDDRDLDFVRAVSTLVCCAHQSLVSTFYTLHNIV
jgi:hypothetical protein